MAGIAVSYRREDTGWITGRIFDRLKTHYERPGARSDRDSSVVFMDYDSTPVGVDFRDYIRNILDNCDVVLAIIGPRWAGENDAGEPRIMRDSDWVRIEIETALKKNIPVVPVLIDRTPMPSPETLPDGMRDLAYRQAATIDTQIDFNSHVERLIRETDRLLGLSTTTPSKPASGSNFNLKHQLTRTSVIALALISFFILAAAVWLMFWGPNKSVDPVYTVYSSPALGVTVVFPNNILTLDNTERTQRKLILRDGNGNPLINVVRTSLPEHKDPKRGRQNEIANLKRMNFVLTYIAPEKIENWSNWYVLSGVNHGTEFYFRRWYTDDSVVSMEFMYPKELAPLFDRLIPTMTHELVYSSSAPKIRP